MSRHEGKFLPVPQPGTKAYWDACKQHKLLIQQCESCGTHQFYPRTICTSCSAISLKWVEASGKATVTSWTIIRHPVSEAYAEEVPYVIALVELQEGPVMMTRMIDCDPESVRSGMAVEACFEDWTENISMPAFRIPVDNDD